MKLHIFGRTITTGTEPEKPKQVKKGLSDATGGFLDFFRQPLSNEKEISAKLIKSNEEWVFVNVSTLAEFISSMEFELFQFKTVKGQVEMEPIEQHELLDLLDKFNEVTTKMDAIYNTAAHLELTGDCFWLLEGGGKPKNIYLLQPDNVSINLGNFTNAGSSLVQSYDYKVTMGQKTLEKTYKPEEIIHIKVPNPANPYRGKSVVEAIATTIDTDNYSQEALKQLFRNGMVADFFLSTEKRVTKEQLKNLTTQFKAAYTGVRNFWKVPVLYGGLEPKPIAKSGREMQLIELEEWLRNKIMSAFKNTRASLGIDDEVNRSTAEASLGHWKRSVIAPKMARIVNALNEYLVPRYGENLILGFKDPVPEDRTAKGDEAVKLYNASIITKNEARQAIGYEEVEDGDDFKITVNPLAQNFDKKMKDISSLKYVNYRRIFRKGKVYDEAKAYWKAYYEARPVAEKIVKGRKKKNDVPIKREHFSFTNEQVWAFWEKQVGVVEHGEEIFVNLAEQFIKEVVDDGLNGIDGGEIQISKQPLLDRAVNRFYPNLNEVVIGSGQLANNLIGVDDPYIPTKAVNTTEAIREQILLFAGSMIDTDIDTMTNLLADGLDKGLSIGEIRRKIQQEFFGEGKRARNQAERITRTEVIKASNLGTQDAFEQSGIVTGKQWLTAMDDRTDEDCDAMNGQIVELESDYDDTIKSLLGEKSSSILSYSSVDYPPLHPNCRCTLLPVIKGQDDFNLLSFKSFQDLRIKIKELEQNVDKRTKDYKNIKKELEESQKLQKDTEEYAEKLEKIAGIGDEK